MLTDTKTISQAAPLSPAGGGGTSTMNDSANGGGQNITAQNAQQILAQHGLQINLSQSKAITDFLYKLAKITIDSG